MQQNVVPTDTRYIPFVQQPYCCSPACIQMILYRNGISLLPQEQIGAELGLVVPTELKGAFFNADARDEPVVDSGFGTRIQDPSCGLDKLIERYGWPFTFSVELASTFVNPAALTNRLKSLVEADVDILICFQNDHGTGHICVVDIVSEEVVRVMNPSQSYPKWRSMKHHEIYERLKAHGDDNYGGIWILANQ